MLGLLGGPSGLCSMAAVLQDLVLDKEASQTSQVEREFNEFIFAKFCCSSSARLCREK